MVRSSRSRSKYGNVGHAGEDIPSDALPITDEQWSDLVINHGRRKFISGQVVEYDPPVIVVVPAAASSRQFKLQLLAAGLLD